MNRVEPIRDIDIVRGIANDLKERSERNHIMFIIGVYSGLRISDILKLRVKDVFGKNEITIRETKTKKQKIFSINPYLKKALRNYIESSELDTHDFLIRSRGKVNKAISRQMAYKILRDIAKEYGLDNIGTHTLRKTFGYHFYKQTKDVVVLQMIFNHSTPEITLRYIGIEQQDINLKMMSFKLL